MTTRIFLVRHGSTTLSAEDRFAGSTDVELSDEGRRQAALLGRRLAESPIAATFCSPMKRTRETADLIAQALGIGVEVRDGLREMDHGGWEQMRRSDVESSFPGEYAAWEEDPYTFAPEGGESGLAVTARAMPVLREIVTKHAGKEVLVVSHKATIRLLLCTVLGIDARGYRDTLDQAPCCLNVLDFKDAVRARLMLLNDVSHYAESARRSDVSLSKWWDESHPR